MSISQPAATEPATIPPAGTRIRLLICLLIILLSNLSSVFALPVNSNSTLIPIDDNGTVDLDVGQRSRLSGQNWGLGVVFIVLGLVEVFYGFRLIRLTLVVTGFLSWAIAAMIIMVAIRWDLVYTTFMPQHYYLWVWLAAGLMGAFLSFRYWDLGVTFAGAFGGFAAAMGVIAAANLAIENVARYVILGVFILGVSAFATFFERIFIILATSFGGAYMFMYGVDELAQVGYREMIVIFDFTGKTLTYHPNWAVYVMLASSLVLAALGSAWEFWHHTTPVFLDRKAIFRIYGRPFGKRPKKLVGQKIHHHLRTRSDVYAYVISCGCFERRTIDDVLYHDDEQCPQDIVQQPPAPVPDPVSGQQPVTSEGKDIDDPASKVPQATTPSDDSNIPLKTAPVEVEDEQTNTGGEEDDVVSALPPSKGTIVVENNTGTDICEKAQQESGTAHPPAAAHDGQSEPSAVKEHKNHRTQKDSGTLESTAVCRDNFPDTLLLYFVPAGALWGPFKTSSQLGEGDKKAEDWFPKSKSRSPYGSPQSFTPFLEEMFLIIGQNESLLGKNVLKEKNKYRSGEDEEEEGDDGDDERQSDDDDEEEAGKKKEDPLAAQVWRLYSQAKNSLPNGQRLENLTWRMMAMTLHKKDQQQAEGPFSQPSSVDTVSSRLPPDSHRAWSGTSSTGSRPCGALRPEADTTRPEHSRYIANVQLGDHQQGSSQFSDAACMPFSLPTPSSSSARSPASSSSQSPPRIANDLLSAQASAAQDLLLQQSMDMDTNHPEHPNLNPSNTGAFPGLAAVAAAAAAAAGHPAFGTDPRHQNSMALYNAYLLSLASASNFQAQQQTSMQPQGYDQFGGPFVGMRPNPLQMLSGGDNQQLPFDFSWLESVMMPSMPGHGGPGRRFGYFPYLSQNPLGHPPRGHASQSNSETDDEDSEAAPPTQCTNCNTFKTPLWRRDQNGLPLCNACGLFLKLHGRTRPLSLKTDVIKKRNRGGANGKSSKTNEHRNKERDQVLQNASSGRDRDHKGLIPDRGNGFHSDGAPPPPRGNSMNDGFDSEAGANRASANVGGSSAREMMRMDPALQSGMFSNIAHQGSSTAQISLKRQRRHSIETEAMEQRAACDPSQAPMNQPSASISPESASIDAFHASVARHNSMPMTPQQDIALLQQLMQQQQQQAHHPSTAFYGQQQPPQQKSFSMDNSSWPPPQSTQQIQSQQQQHSYPPSYLLHNLQTQYPIQTTTNMYNKTLPPTFEAIPTNPFDPTGWSQLNDPFFNDFAAAAAAAAVTPVAAPPTPPSVASDGSVLSKEEQQHAYSMLLAQYWTKVSGQHQ
ncbi:hypothetical protein BGZ75_001267 [Mortierella antarctica]|nr:hypothetical protein BGZ75_001267 [Mortierella antarctica]